MKSTRILFAAAVALLLTVGGGSSAQEEEAALTCFYSKNCHKCAALMEDVMPKVTASFAGALRVEYKDIGDPQNYKLLFGLKKKYSSDYKTDFPVLYLNGKFIDARRNDNLTLASVSGFIKDALRAHPVSGVPSGGDAGVAWYFEKMGVYAVITAALADGINPCSFTVMVFFISFLFLYGYRRRSIVIAGTAFIASVFITYLLIGVGLFGVLYAVKGFWTVAKAVNICVGAFSIALGIFSIYDIFRFLKSGRTEDVLLKLPKRVKNKIHGMIGAHYRTDRSSVGDNVFAIIAGTLAVGFLVSIFESVCTGQLYLPTIVFMLKESHYKIQAAGYLLMYNLFFIMPLILIFLFAMAGVSSQAFSAYMKRHLVLIKVLLAALFIVLGASLVRAETAINREVINARKEDPYFWDFGPVKEGDILRHRFYVRNDSRETLEIIAINSSCKCIASAMRTKTILPGRRVPLDVKFDTKGYFGDNTRRMIYVNTNSEKRPVITFEVKADIQKKYVMPDAHDQRD